MTYGTTTTTWMPAAATDYTALQGKDVVSADGEKVGSIKKVFVPAGAFAAAQGHYYFLLDPGLMKEWFGGFSDLYLPESAIAAAGADHVTLRYTRDQVKDLGWSAPPAEFAADR